MSQGLTADLKKPVPPRREPEGRTLPVLAIALALTLCVGLCVGFLASFVATDTGEDGTEPGVLSMEATRYLTISNTWDVETYQEFYPALSGGTVTEGTNGVLYAGHDGEHYYIRACMVSFEPSIVLTDFISANITLPLDWLALSGNATVSVYEIQSPWKTWDSPDQTDGATWASVRDGSIATDREPVDTVVLNVTEHGFGTETRGVAVLDMREAVFDWIDGTWDPSNGLLLAIIAPWETLDYEWLDPSDVGYLAIFDLGGARIAIETWETIPEFGTVLAPTVATLAIVFLLGRAKRG